jgi:putative flippase GtrA
MTAASHAAASPVESGSSLSFARQAASFGVIGVFSTLAYVALYAALRVAAPAEISNAVALLATALGNTAANRRLTFEVRGTSGLGRHHAAGLLALGVALAITTASLGALALAAPRHGRLTEIAVLVAANALATLVRFLILRLAISPSRDRRLPVSPAMANLSYR